MGINQEALTAGTVHFYDVTQREDRNLRLSAESGIVDHHFGVGYFDTSQLTEMSQHEISAAIRVLEENQAKMLIDLMGDMEDGHKVLDAGCGRGGTAFRLCEAKGCIVDGVTIAPYQASFATDVARKKGLSDRARFCVMNFLRTGFPNKFFDHIFSNETTMYAVRLEDLFSEFRRVLKPGRKYTLATWNINQDFGSNNPYVEPINKHYGVVMHSDVEYKEALVANGFEVEADIDLTEEVIPHWELRSQWDEAAGVEQYYLEGHKRRAILYKMISAKLIEE